MINLLARFEEFLRANLPKAASFHPHYERALGEMLLAGGKRFRPALVLAAADAFNPRSIEQAFFAALSVETLHTYSLIHDDLPDMDNADFRRSHPTLHKTYDAVTAILAGDALNSYAFEILAKAPIEAEKKVRLIAILAENGGAAGMVLGQALDCHFEGRRLDVARLEFIHRNKTGRLIAASLQMGAIVGGAAEAGAAGTAGVEAIYDLGMRLGLYFQIRDDIIDAIGDEAAAGKPTHADMDKNSFVTLLGLDEAEKRAKTEAHELQESIALLSPRLRSNLNEVLKGYF